VRLLGSFIVLTSLLVAAGCSGPPEVAWTRVPLPAGAEPRDVADCDGAWLVTGGQGGGPAAWTGDTWTPVRFEPLAGSYYGPRQVIGSVACADGRIAMVGAVPGGAHGNPRVSTWRSTGSGSMAENAAPFETYGGDEAVDVGRIAAGPGGFAIAGDRVSGGAGWFSADGVTYTLREIRGGGPTVARDAVALADGRWLIVGGAGVKGRADQRAAAWITRDGRAWEAADPPVAPGYNEVQRAVRQGDDVVAAGMRGTAFAVWRRHDGRWAAQGTFGGDPGGVRDLALAGDRVVVAGGSALWVDGHETAAPGPPLAVAARGDDVLVVTADGLWRATLSGG